MGFHAPFPVRRSSKAVHHRTNADGLFILRKRWRSRPHPGQHSTWWVAWHRRFLASAESRLVRFAIATRTWPLALVSLALTGALEWDQNWPV